MLNIFVAEKNTDPLALKTKSSVKLPALHCKTATDMSPAFVSFDIISKTIALLS